MYYLLSHYSIFALCVLFVILFILIAWSGLFIVRKRVSRETLEKNHEVAAAIFDIAGLIYSLVLAFVIIAVWEDYEKLDSAIEGEAEELSILEIHAAELPDSVQLLIQNAMNQYAVQVVKNEWHTQARKRMPNSYLHDLRLQLYKLHTEKESEQRILDRIDEYLDHIADLRNDRVTHNHSRVPALVWLILIIGTIIVIICSYLYYVEPPWLHYFFVALLATLIAMSLFLVFMLDHPFEGSSGVSPQPFIDLYSSDVP